MSGSMNIIQKTKMTLQNQWKLLTQLKGYLNKSENDKNVQLILSREWMDLIQKVTYAQFNSIRNFSVAQILKDKADDDSKAAASKGKTDEGVVKSVAVSLPEDKIKPSVGEAGTKRVEETGKGSLQADLREQIYSLPQVLSALFPQFNARTNKETLVAAVPKWKTNLQTNVSKHSIASRTRHVLNSIATAESVASKWRRIEDLLIHIEQYPEARHHAIKEGAIGILLRARQKIKDPQINGNDAYIVLLITLYCWLQDIPFCSQIIILGLVLNFKGCRRLDCFEGYSIL